MEYYELIKSNLDSKYNFINKGEKGYYLDESGKIVATLLPNLVTIFYTCSEDVIWNHKNRVAVGIAKNFVVGNCDDVRNIEAMFINGLCGACNDLNLINNFAIESYVNRDFGDRNIGSIGCVILSSQKYEFVSDIFNFGVALNQIKYNNFDDLNLFELNYKGEATINYEDVYNYHRIKNDWYYTTGFNTVGSRETRRRTENKKHRTYDSITKTTLFPEYKDLILYSLNDNNYIYLYSNLFEQIEEFKYRKRQEELYNLGYSNEEIYMDLELNNIFSKLTDVKTKNKKRSKN